MLIACYCTENPKSTVHLPHDQGGPVCHPKDVISSKMKPGDVKETGLEGAENLKMGFSITCGMWFHRLNGHECE